MKFKAKQVPYSSIVGSSVVLEAEDGRAGFIIAVLNGAVQLTRDQHAQVAREITRAINECGGLDVDV
jgi:chitinase